LIRKTRLMAKDFPGKTPAVAPVVAVVVVAVTAAAAEVGPTDLPAGVGEVVGCRHFFTNGGLGSFWRTALRNLIADPCLDRPPGCRGNFFGVPRSGSRI
jgi:hypothetical protein